MKFRKKPVVIEAFRLEEGGYLPDWANFVTVGADINAGGNRVIYALIDTLEGVMRANEGDWIIKGVKGELYPCKPDIFAATYEPIEETA